MEDISLIIKELRIKKKMSQGDLAKAMGKSHQAVSKWENGKSIPRPNEFEKIEEVLGVPFGTLTGNVKSVHPYTNIHYVPILETKVTASFIETFAQNKFTVQEKYPVYYSQGEEPNESQIVFVIDGDSMSNQVKDGSKVLFESVPDGNINYINSGIYAIVFDSQFVIKLVKENDIQKHGYLTLYTDDGTNSYFRVERSLIRKVWRAIRIVEQKL